MQWGNGSFDVMLDLESWRVWPYSNTETAAAFHQEHGGRCYYTSNSGLSGAGWVPDGLHWVYLGTYATHTGNPKITCEGQKGPFDRVLAPIDYRTGQVPQDWPFVVRRPLGGVLTNPNHLRDVLLENPEGRVVSSSHRFVQGPGWQPGEQTFATKVVDDPWWKFPRWTVARVVEMLNHDRLRFNAPERLREEPFWKRLGLYPDTETLFGATRTYYKVVRGIVRQRLTAEEISTVEGLQSVSPRNVLVLRSGEEPLVLHETREEHSEGVEMRLLGLFRFGGHEFSYEHRIDAKLALKLVSDRARTVEGKEFLDQLQEARCWALFRCWEVLGGVAAVELARNHGIVHPQVENQLDAHRDLEVEIPGGYAFDEIFSQVAEAGERVRAEDIAHLTFCPSVRKLLLDAFRQQ
jgi:hypothetical protein